MAFIINEQNVKTEIHPKNQKTKKFTLSELTNLLGGVMITPAFLGDWWIFKKADESGEKNYQLSELFSAPIFGSVIIAKDEELSSTFFFPRSLVKKIAEQLVQEQQTNIQKTDVNQNLDKMEDYEKEQFIEESREIVFNTVYKQLFSITNDFNYIKNNFLITDFSGSVRIPENKQFDFISQMLNHYIKKEYYEQCQILCKYKEFLIEEQEINLPFFKGIEYGQKEHGTESDFRAETEVY